MEATVLHLLIPQKCINSKQKTLRWKKTHYVSKDFTANNMKKNWLNGYAYEFSVDFNTIYTGNIIDIHKHLMKKHDVK